MVGADFQLASTVKITFIAALAICLTLASSDCAAAESMYKYRGESGEWIYSDRPPVDEEASEVRELEKGTDRPQVLVTHQLAERQLRFVARNEYHAPVQLIIGLQRLHNLEAPPADEELHWTLLPRSTTDIMSLRTIDDNVAPSIEYRFAWVPGDPQATHNPFKPYRAPFAVARQFTVSQAFPVTMTHTTADSRYAVDISMPIGTDIYAARSGTVFDVSSTNYRGGLDPSRDGAAANLIRILHDDGTYAVYAHLNWNTIRVRPGDIVERGEYIADSGNTGFSTGPHLHFAVIRNRGLRLESLPVVFEGPNSIDVEAEAGGRLSAY